MKQYSGEVKEKARALREKGSSLGSIAKELRIPKTTAHSWIADVIVSDDLKKKIRASALASLQEGRVKAQNLTKQKRALLQKKLIEKGKQKVGTISERELYIAGIALYWAEGFKNKHEHRLGFCNSDPAMVKFYLHWLEKCLFVKQQDVIARVTVNSAYENKIEEIETYWSHITGIPLSQFTKPFYQNTQWKKQFNDDNYHGVLRIHVRNSLEYLLEMKGWIEGLKQNTPG